MLDPLEKKLLKEYGATDDIFEAGYVLSDGTAVDFSGRSQAGGYVRIKDRFVPKRGPDRIYGRNLDHRQFPEGFSEALGTGNGSEMMRRFMERTGAIRVNASSGFSVYRTPPVEAVSSFLDLWGERPLHVDALTADGSGAMASQELPPNLEAIMEFLLNFYEKRSPSLGAIWKKGPKDWSPSGRIPGEPVWPEFVASYLEAAIWSSTDQSGNPLDRNYDVKDFTPEAIKEAINDCNDFIASAEELLRQHGDQDQNGHDFWLTRNGHGAGFWDRGYGKDGEELTALAQTIGERHIIVGGDGKLRFL